MTPANIAFLVLVLAVFAVFIVVLGATTLYVWLGDRPGAASSRPQVKSGKS